jgi:hypothetical protein
VTELDHRRSRAERQQREKGTLAEAATNGRLALLIALRDEIALELDAGVPARDLASLSRRLMELSREIERVEAAGIENPLGKASETPDERWTPADNR